jgi:small-conductance mechanosensitive channel
MVESRASIGGRRRRAAARSSIVCLVALLAAPLRGEVEPTPVETAAVDWIRPEEVPARADALVRRLEGVRPEAGLGSWLANVERSLPQLDHDLDAALQSANEAMERSGEPADLEDIRREIIGIAEPLDTWKRTLAEEATRVAQVLDEIEQGERVWETTRRRPENVAAEQVVVRRIESSIEALEGAASTLRAWRARVLAVSDKVIDRGAAADAMLEKLRAANIAERQSLFVPDRPPLWSRGFSAQLRDELPHAPATIDAYAQSTVAYIARDPRPLVVQVLITALAMFVLGRFASGARHRLAGEEAASRAARLLERPYAMALLIMLIATPLFHPLAPRRFMQLVASVALFPAARILTHAAGRVNVRLFASLLVLLLLDRLGLAFQPLPALERTAFLLMLATMIVLAVWISRRVDPWALAPWVRHAAHLAIAALLLAVLAEVGGWSNLATLLGRGVLAGAVGGIYVYAAAIALSAFFNYALVSAAARRVHVIGRNAAFLQRQVEGALRWIGAGLWLFFLATAVGMRTAIAENLGGLLDAGISIGALSLSVGGVIAFVVTLFTALLLARFVTALLEEDVYPRARLPRGMPYVLSTLVRYGFYTLGFLFALAAAGVQLGQVAIMMGGLGIGIGLGLQDLVKNFAAGLTLLFERRVQVGDALEMPSQGIFGRVLSIGMRASVVRSWNGAEVVVPNADLISSAVTNWTMSDRLCRIEVAVGVAYGTDPERVMALLLDAARSDDQLLSNPAPVALFKGFGESSLDFVVRAWIDQGYEQALERTSDLALAVHRRLVDAGIGIPYPQRDLHLASVSEAARAALSKGERKG